MASEPTSGMFRAWQEGFEGGTGFLCMAVSFTSGPQYLAAQRMCGGGVGEKGGWGKLLLKPGRGPTRAPPVTLENMCTSLGGGIPLTRMPYTKNGILSLLAARIEYITYNIVK